MKANFKRTATGSIAAAGPIIALDSPSASSPTQSVDVEPDARGPDDDLVTGLELAGLDAAAVDAHAVGGVEVGQVPVGAPQCELEVAARHVRVLEHVVAALAAADDRARAVDHEPLAVRNQERAA